MCGFAGSFDYGGAHTALEEVRSMVGVLSHRGPDGVRATARAPVALGHARLRVIDLSTEADQPMSSDDGELSIVFNGEVYNFPELRKELEADGHRFRTRSDTEVVLKLFERDGPKAIERLDGMFAFAVWDRRRQQLTLARDRAGQKPLFFFRDRERIVFASEIKALHRHRGVPRRPNSRDLPYYLTFGYFPAPRTAYEEIWQLPPASWMRVGADGSTRTERYWTPPFHPNGTRNLAEASERLRPLMESAVRKRLIADVPVGAFLSGGLDSTIVVGLMSRFSSRPVQTFSVGFDDAPEYDETRYAELVAKSFGCEHTRLQAQPPDGELLELMVHHYDGPFGDSSAIPSYAVSRQARRSVTVVLNGDGGDELFAGYSRLAMAALSERLPTGLRKLASSFRHLLPEPRLYAHPLRRVKRGLEAVPLPLEQRILFWTSFFRDADRLLRRDHQTDVRDHFRVFLEEAASATPLARLLHLNYCTYLPEDLLVKMDRMTMAHGLEARSPFLDADLTGFATRLPDHLKLRFLRTKWVLRQSFQDLVPKQVNSRSKMGFGVPLGAWFRGPWQALMTENLRASSAPIYEFLEPSSVARYLDEHQSSRVDWGQQLFCLLTLALWLRTF